MIERASFETMTIELGPYRKATKIIIALCLTNGDKHGGSMFPISGFPRPLIADEMPDCISHTS